MHNEVEVKIEVNSFEDIEKSLLENNWILEYSTIEEVSYFDDSDDSRK